MNKRSASFLSLLLNDLAEPAEAAEYLSAAWEDSTQMFLTAVKDVLQARQIAAVARESGVTREHLYRTFTKDGNPTIATLRSVLRAVGLDFPGISTLEAIASASSSPPAVQTTSRRRAARSHRISAARNASQYSLPFESVAAQVTNTSVPLALAAIASANSMSARVNSMNPQPQQNQQPPLPAAWMIEQFSPAGAQGIGREIA